MSKKRQNTAITERDEEMSDSDDSLAFEDNMEDTMLENSFQDNEWSRASSPVDTDIPLMQRLIERTEAVTWQESDDFHPTIHAFTDTNSGLQNTIQIDEASTVLDIFQLFFPEELAQIICDESNVYHRQQVEKQKAAGNFKEYSRLNAPEIKMEEIYLCHAV